MLVLGQREPTRRTAWVEVREVVPGDGGFRALTDDTVLYPEGGGQPRDFGTLGGVPVLDVLRTPAGVVHLLGSAIPTGPAEVAVDWARRFDHMQQHTAQHLLTAVAQDGLGLATTSFHLHPGALATCDVELDGELGADALPALEAGVDAEILAARAVTTELCEPGELAERGVRTRGLPDGFSGEVRLVRIAGVDLNTCGGTHVASTAELQAVALLGVERVRGGTRLTFVAGGRVRAHLHAAAAALTEAGAALSRPPHEVPEGVRRLLADAKDRLKERDAAEVELLDHCAAALVVPAPIRHLHREAATLPWANALVSRVLAADPEAHVLITMGSDDDGSFLLAGPAAWVAAEKAGLLAALGARGGGPPGRLQGRGRVGARGAWLTR